MPTFTLQKISQRENILSYKMTFLPRRFVVYTTFPALPSFPLFLYIFSYPCNKITLRKCNILNFPLSHEIKIGCFTTSPFLLRSCIIVRNTFNVGKRKRRTAKGKKRKKKEERRKEKNRLFI